jgi:hypothetical protein
MKYLKIALAVAGLSIAPQAFSQDDGSGEYADSQCNNGQYVSRGFSNYEDCFEAARAYYYSLGYPVGGGGGGGSGGGGGGGAGGGGTWDLPNVNYDGCTARSRLCNDGPG